MLRLFLVKKFSRGVKAGEAVSLEISIVDDGTKTKATSRFTISRRERETNLLG